MIYFCAPSDFNDPYDCAIAARTAPLKDEEIQQLRELILAEANPELEDELRRLEDERLRRFVEFRVSQIVDKFRRDLRDTIGIACFTESNDNLLMWSHYADRGRGICLEFDTAFEPFTLMRRVNYVEKFPELNALQIMTQEDRASHIDLFCTKSSDWKYEREWRSLHRKAGTKWCYESAALRAIYFGPEVDRIHVEVVCLVVQGQYPAVQFFQSKRSQSEFRLEFDEFKYVPAGQQGGLLDAAQQADP